MSFPILIEYSAKFPQMSSLLDSLPALYSRKYPPTHKDYGTNSQSASSNSSITHKSKEKLPSHSTTTS
jgi:hypothetical protein